MIVGDIVDVTTLHWSGDFMLNEILGLDYDELDDESNFIVGEYYEKSNENRLLRINMNTNEIIEILELYSSEGEI